jgi:ribosomal protein L18E
MIQGELLVIDALSEGFRNAERNGDEPSWKEIQERLKEARRLILSQEEK